MNGIMANLKPIIVSIAIFPAFLAAGGLIGGPAGAQEPPPATEAPPAGEAQPQDARARLALLMERLKAPDLPNWEQVVEEIRAIWSKSGSDTMDLLLERGRDAIERQDYRAAVAHLSALIDHDPEFAEAWNSRAIAWFHLGHFGLALADISRALDLNPRHFGALAGLGLIYEETGHPEAALRAYEAAGRLNPHDPQIRQALERIRRALGGFTL